MSKKATAKTGRLVWIEPNKMDEVSDTGTFDYEDYSICVDLEVRIPKRSACGDETDVITFHTNHETAKDRISFFTGTDGYLTTSFTDITAADPTSNKETLGVSSIDISYNSYFYPQVTIKFVDVRGSSLMYPQEDMFKNGSQGSFFKALFCFPYPQFILKVKGFYGKQVQYDLAVEDFKTSFNPETGNFECIVQFIGYMYGIYADLPMSYLVVAPYADFNDTTSGIRISGKSYWEEQVRKGIFVYDDNGKPIDTLISLYVNLSRIESELKKKEQTSPYILDKNLLTTKLSHYETVENNYASWKRTVENTYRFYYGEKYIHIYTSEKPKKSDINGWEFDNVILASWGLLNSSIKQLNSYESTLKYLGEYESIMTNDLGNEIHSQANNDSIFIKYENLQADKKNDLISGGVIAENQYVFSFEHFNFLKMIMDAKENISAELEAINKKIDADRQIYLNETLGFVPNIKNIFKIIFAHLDTFIHIYYQVLDNIKTNKNNISSSNPRSPLQLSLNADNSDLVRNENFVPPYPLVVKKDGQNKKEVMWPGNYTPAKDMIELKFVESLFRGIRNVESENRLQVRINSNNKSETDVLYIPTRNGVYNSNTDAELPIACNCIHDFYYFNNPYTFFRNRDNINLYNIYTFLACRLLNIEGLPDSYSARNQGCIEAINFYKAVPILREDAYNQQVFIQYLKNKPTSDDFIKFIGLTDENNDVSLLNRLGNENGVLFDSHAKPFLNSKLQLPVNYNLLTNVNFVNKSDTFFPKVPFILTKTDFEKIVFFYDLWVRHKNDWILKDDDKTKYQDYIKSVFKNNFLIDLTSYKDKDAYESDMINFIIKASLLNHNPIVVNSVTNWVTGLVSYDYKEDPSWKVEWISHMYLMDNGKQESFSLGDKIDYFINLNAFEDAKKALQGLGTGCVIDPSYMYGGCLYGHSFYYAQNYIEDNEKKLLSKAYLFLEACAPIANKSIPDDKIGFYPEWTILLCGARSWRKKEIDDPIITTGTVYDVSCDKNYPSLQMSVEHKVDSTLHKRSGGGTTAFITSYSTSTSTSRNIFRPKIKSIGEDETYLKLKFIEHDYLIDEFKRWALSEFVLINNELELKGINNETFLPSDIQGLNELVFSFHKNSQQTKNEIEETLKNFDKQCDTLVKLISSCLTDDGTFKLKDVLKSILDKNVYKNYSYINPGVSNLSLALNHKRDISKQLFVKKLKNIVVYSPIMTKVTTGQEKIRQSFSGFTETLLSLYTHNNGFENTISGDNNAEELATEIMLRNDDLKLSLYLTLKNLYDRWFCANNKEKWDLSYYVSNGILSGTISNSEKYALCEYNKFFFIDSFYNDIGSKICFNMHTFKELINSVIADRVGDDSTMTNGMKFQGMSIYQFMSSVLQKNSMTFMAVPCFNTYKTEESICELFTPFSWFDRGEPRGTSYIGIYPHQVSHHLDIEGANGYQYSNDGWDIADVNGDFKDVIEIPDLVTMDGGYTMPAFGVTYGKQDQSYFKKVTVNMDNPQVTEYSIGATLDIANHYGENQKVQTFVGQDLYKVYSNHSYTCTVEMMGNAMITPLMYFQLNNIPMFRGAYMVIKVEHNISQGNMTTVFTGVRMSKNKIPYVTPTLEGEVVEDNLVDNGSSNNDTGNKSGGDSNTTVTPSTPEEVGENVSKVLKYARAAIGIIEYGYDINKKEKEQIKYNKDTAPNGWISNYVPYPTKEKDPDGIYKPIQSDSSDGPQWCCIFISWCAMRAGISPALSTGTGGWYKGENWDDKYNTKCDEVYNYYKKEAGRVIEMNDNNIVNNPPQPGDFLLKKNTNTEKYPDKLFGHILMVEAYNPEKKTITVIHGNASQRVKRDTFSYDKVKDTYTHYCRPYYAGDTSSNVPSTGPTTPTPTTQPSTDTSTQNSDALILRTVDEKINFIKAIICQESENKHSAVGDKDVEGGNAIGIMQIRPIMYREINRVRNMYKKQNYILGQPFPGTKGTEEERKALTRDDQVKGFIAVMEHTNKIKNSYLKTGQDKRGDAIPWDFRKCCAVWNCGNRNAKCSVYYNEIKKHYDGLKAGTKTFPPGDGNGWTPNAAFNSFFS